MCRYGTVHNGDAALHAVMLRTYCAHELDYLHRGARAGSAHHRSLFGGYSNPLFGTHWVHETSGNGPKRPVTKKARVEVSGSFSVVTGTTSNASCG